MMLSLSACQGESVPAPSREFSGDDINKLIDADVFSEELETLDADTAYALYRLADYGLEREDLADCTLIRSAGATCEEAAVLIMADDDVSSVEKLEDMFQALEDYLENQIEANKEYRPAEIPKLEDAFLMRRGYSFVMVVSEAGRNAVKTALGVVE